MVPLVETTVGFVAIMLVLSFLVKSLTTLISDHFDFYCDNFQYEVSRLIRNATGRTWEQWASEPATVSRLPWVADIKWERLGDEFFSEDNVRWVVSQLRGVSPDQVDVKGLVAVHLGKVKYAYQQRLKNLSIAAGLGLCLLLDINGLTIWRTLYQNNQLRTAFSSNYATEALTFGDDLDDGSDAPPVPARRARALLRAAAPAARGYVQDGSQEPDDRPRSEADENLQKARTAFTAQLSAFMSDVSFGIGKAWRESGSQRPQGVRGWAVEFIGAFLTGIFVSVGAPYWHDLLEGLTSLRKSKVSAASSARA
jgi:hypothetical protein